MTPETALYAYAVLPADAAVPTGAPSILPGAALALLAGPGCAMLISAVPRAPFVEGPACRTGEPDWIAARARAHHAVVAAAAACGPVLPLAFGALFSGPQPVQAWLAARAARLRAALAEVAGCAEFTARLEEDTEHHIAWLDAHDDGLRALAERAQQASAGTAFLLGQSRARRLTEARAARQAALARDLAARMESHARALPGAMTALVPEADVPALRADLERIAAQLAGTGLALRLAGPWPPYAFARTALADG
jgi:hypothetical protein